MILANAATADAVYGPPPPPIPVPGGYFQVVTSQTIGASGGTIGPLSAGNVTATLVMPAGSFRAPQQVTITEPDVAAIGNGGRRGYLAIGGVGVVIQHGNGSPYLGLFSRPLILTLTSPQFSPGDLVVAWNGSRFVPVPGATVRNHTVTIRIFNPALQFYAVLSPTRAPLIAKVRRSARHGTSSAVASRSGAREAIFAALIRRPAGTLLPGLGVLAPTWLNAIAEAGRGVAS